MKQTRKTDDILGVNIDVVTMKEAIDRFFMFLEGSSNHTIYTPNAEIIYSAQKDDKLKVALNQSDMNIADGAGVVLGSKLLGKAIVEKVSGLDLVRNVIADNRAKGMKMFLFGGAPGVAELAAFKMLEINPNIIVAGFRDGYYNGSEEKTIIEIINKTGPDVLFVALGAPRQEKFIHKYKDELNVKVCIGVGGSLDVISGKVKVAPDFFRRNGIEWLYRLCKQPKRFIRMLALPKFILKVIFIKETK